MANTNQPKSFAQVVEALERLGVQMRRHLERDEPITVEDFRSVMLFVEWVVTEFTSLQDVMIQ